MKKTKLTINEIARLAEVSPSTVSLVMNGKGRIGEAVRERVLAVVKEMNYSPRAAGRGRKVGMGDIAVVCPITADMADRQHGYGAWIMAAQNQLLQYGGRPQLFVGASRIEQDIVFQKFLNDGALKGAVLFGTNDEDGYIQKIIEAGLPAVVAHRLPKRHEFSYVTLDDERAAGSAAERLLELGHRHCAVVCHPHNLAWNTDRRNGFRQACLAGGASSKEYVVDPNGNDRVFDALASKIRKSEATGIFASNDYVGMRLLDAFHRAGVNVPKDCSIIGFDHTEYKSTEGLRLTSVALDDIEVGRTAARILRDLVGPQAQITFEGVLLQTRLMEEDTTGPAPGKSIPRSRRKG